MEWKERWSWYELPVSQWPRRPDFEADFESFAIGSWLDRIGVTHVLAHDKGMRCFAGFVRLCGISFAQKKGCRLPDSFRVVGTPTRPAMLVGGKSGYRMRVWQTGQTL